MYSRTWYVVMMIKMITRSYKLQETVDRRPLTDIINKFTKRLFMTRLWPLGNSQNEHHHHNHLSHHHHHDNVHTFCIIFSCTPYEFSVFCIITFFEIWCFKNWNRDQNWKHSSLCCFQFSVFNYLLYSLRCVLARYLATSRLKAYSTTYCFK